MHLGLKLHKPEVNRLPISLKAALAAACTQRQAEAFRVCKRRTDGSAKEFDDLLERIWEDARSPQASQQERKRREATAEKLLQTKDNRSDMYQPNVECVLLSLLYTNDVLMRGQAEDAIYAADHAFESIWNFLTSPFCKEPEIGDAHPDEVPKVMAHSLTQAEHLRQERDLFESQQAVLRGEKISSIVERLRKRAELEAHSFIPIWERTHT
jgi:hypothetical protein